MPLLDSVIFDHEIIEICCLKKSNFLLSFNLFKYQY